jgi:hypothetical protein
VRERRARIEIHMPEEIDIFVGKVREVYRPILQGAGGRIRRGDVLWNQFEDVVCAINGNAHSRQLTEKVNEMVVAKILADDVHLTGTIEYEPNYLPNGQRIDFIAERGNENIYVEVKTVHPRTPDDDAAWQNYLRRREHHPQNVNFVVQRDAMGGALYGDSFSSRSHFLRYTLAFEERLAAAKAIRGGPGIMVFCGNGFAWNISDLEDFADFYRFGRHRGDDPFALMEQHHIEENGLAIRRNVDHFAHVKRAVEQPDRQEFVLPVRGPHFGR